jgi:hypothetical protein
MEIIKIFGHRFDPILYAQDVPEETTQIISKSVSTSTIGVTVFSDDNSDKINVGLVIEGNQWKINSIRCLD